MSWKFWLVIASYCWLTTIPKSWEAWLQVFTVHFFTDVTATITLFIQENYIMLPVLGHVINPQTYFLSHTLDLDWERIARNYCHMQFSSFLYESCSSLWSGMLLELYDGFVWIVCAWLNQGELTKLVNLSHSHMTSWYWESVMQSRVIKNASLPDDTFTVVTSATTALHQKHRTSRNKDLKGVSVQSQRTCLRLIPQCPTVNTWHSTLLT